MRLVTAGDAGPTVATEPAGHDVDVLVPEDGGRHGGTSTSRAAPCSPTGGAVAAELGR